MPAPDAVPGSFWRRLFDIVLQPATNAELDPPMLARAEQQAPVIWLLGKVQSGKTSIVRAITGRTDAEVGLSFRACTLHSRVYDFPEDMPVVRFLDTRGLGEVDYDPAEDLALVEGHSHIVVAVARVGDPDQQSVRDVLRAVRRRHPDWSLVLVQTRLHDLYPDDRDHPPYARLQTGDIPTDLRRALEEQARMFADLPGSGSFRAVAVDLTRPDDGFAETDYGIEALIDALDEACSDRRMALIRALARAARDARLAGVHPRLLGYAAAAGASDLVPVMGFVTVPTVQGRMLYSIGRHYRIAWDRQTLREFVASLGTGTAIGIGASFTARQLAKLVPVYGQLAGAAAAGTATAAITYALGRAACYYLEQVRLGQRDPKGVANTYHGALREAWHLFGPGRSGRAVVDRKAVGEDPGGRPVGGGS